MSKPMSMRLDDIHVVLLERMVEKLTEKGIKTNKTDVIQNAIYYFARDRVLDAEEVSKIIDEHYSGIYKDLDF
jgi:hypothetical protein